MVGSSRVATVRLEASPATLPADGGEVLLVATVRGPAGEPVGGAPVTFRASGGTLSPSTPVASDGQGMARARLRLTGGASVRARVQDSTWLDVDVSRWPVTSTLKGVSFDGLLCMPHTKAGQWPVVNGVEGNPWVIVNIGGRWYASTFEWLRRGQICKGINADNIGPHTKNDPLRSWRPKSGELVGFMVSTHARWSADSPVQERSNIVMVRWP